MTRIKLMNTDFYFISVNPCPYGQAGVAFAKISVLIFYIGYIWQLKFSFQCFLVKGFKITTTELVVDFEAGTDYFVAFFSVYEVHEFN